MLLPNVHLIHINAVNKPSPLSIPVRSQQNIIPAHHPLTHLALAIKSPVLKPVTALPTHPVLHVLILVPELYSNAILGKGKQLLAQTVVAFPRPFGSQEVDDGFCSGEEGGAVAPDAVRGVGLRHARGISTWTDAVSGPAEWVGQWIVVLLGVPRVLGSLDLFAGGVVGEGGFNVSHCGLNCDISSINGEPRMLLVMVGDVDLTKPEIDKPLTCPREG